MSNKMYTGSYNGRGQSNVSSNNSNGSLKRRNTTGKSAARCDYCKYKGHTRENCFKLHDYPSDFKNKRRGGAPHAQANNVVNSSCSEPQVQGEQVTTTPAPAHFFTQEQYQQILHLLNKDKEVESAPNVVAAGPTGTAHAFMTNLVHNNWIIDTGATNHMVHSLNLLETYDEIPENARSKVHLPTEEHVSITHVGIYSFFKNKKVQNILHIPEFKYNLLSVSKLTKELRCLAAFYPDFYVFQELSSGKVLGIGKEEFGLYILKAASAQSTSFLFTSISFYLLLGHDPLKVLRSVKSLHDMHFKQHHWTVCPVAKQSRLPFLVSSSYFKSAFDMVHGDVWGPYRNGTVERKHRSILDMARALRFQAHLPPRFWGECVSTVVYLLNRLPSTVLQGKSPFDKLFQRSPSLQHLRVFGSLCYATQVRKGDIFCPRAIPVVHMSYSSSQKGYILYDPCSKRFFVSREIVFKEEVFPFKRMSSGASPLFPVLELVEQPTQSSVVPNATPSPAGSHILNNADADAPSSTSLSPLPSPVPSPTSACESSDPSVPLRKSSRLTKPPVWLADYVVPSKNSVCSYPMINNVAYDKLSPSYRSSLTGFSAIVEPKSFAEASQDPSGLRL
ncbi:PREDICTED: uncharacterized protein LOC109224467 [Nicotiana attenuata]|uniref:uncharacterized protein LOC109224467 n=1 Tax=Nicotiana attenuata TaxID=49451 RepID=UPI0009059E3B|nr:PREDICTED: uncharacterized protein LOC109224467 [Nicotiana attenuata]